MTDTERVTINPRRPRHPKTPDPEVGSMIKLNKMKRYTKLLLRHHLQALALISLKITWSLRKVNYQFSKEVEVSINFRID